MKPKNKKVTIIVAPPCAGKTKWTNEQLRKDPDTVSVSRDGFRKMLRNSGTLEIKLETMVTELVELTIVHSLMYGMNVIIDNTNLKASHIDRLIELVKFKADVEFLVLDVPLKTCLERNALREEKKLSEQTLRDMYKDYKIITDSYVFQNVSKRLIFEDRFVPAKQDKTLPEACIFDIDGTIALMGRRGEFDWDKVGVDDPNYVVIEQIEFARSKGRKIILVSARDGSSSKATTDWLEAGEIYYDEIYFRPEDDGRKDHLIKKLIYEEHIKDRFNVVAVYDDRLQPIKTWYDLGLFCFNVNQGNKLF